MIKKNLESTTTRSQWSLVWRKFKRNRLARLGGLTVFVLAVVTLFAPFFSPYDYKEQDLKTVYVPPQRVHFFDQNGHFHFQPFTYKLKLTLDPNTYARMYKEDTSIRYPVKFFVHTWGYRLFGVFRSDLHLFGVSGEGSIFLFGTDSQGRDLFSRVIYGGRISLTVSVLSAIATSVIGAIIGAISGFYGGIIDMILQRLVELLLCFPQLALWMALSASFPPQWPPQYALYGIMGIFTLLSWPTLAREVRGKVLSYREADYIAAAKAVGASNSRIIFVHIIPQALSHIIAVTTLNIPLLIIAESTLSFLGLGIQPPMVSWGVLLKNAQNLQTLGLHPWIMIPGVFIMIAVLGFNFLGDGLRDAADPYSR